MAARLHEGTNSMIIAIVIIVALALLYALGGRTWLKKQSWMQWFFDAIEPIEITLWRKSETILLSRLVSIGGVLVTIHDSVAVFASQLDWTPLTVRVLSSVPDDMRPLVVSGAVSLVGYVFEWLRKTTTKPLEIVEIADKDMTPQVARAVAVAEAAKVEAVAVVADAKAEKEPA
jgi:hypothetical protein